MEETLQLLSFFISFVFGFFFHLCARFHFKVSDKYPILLKYVSTFLFLLDGVLFYLLLLYYLNGGVLHIYFLFFVFLGFFLYGYLQKRVKLCSFLTKCVDKIFRR